MSKIIAFDVPQPGVTFADIKPHLEAEAKHAWALYKAGIFRELYLRTDRPGAVVVLECTDLDEAKQIVADLPLVEEGLIQFEFVPIGPFLSWEALFVEE